MTDHVNVIITNLYLAFTIPKIVPC